MATQHVGPSCPLSNRPPSRFARDRQTLIDVGYSPEVVRTIMGDTGQLSVMLRFRDYYKSPKSQWVACYQDLGRRA